MNPQHYATAYNAHQQPQHQQQQQQYGRTGSGAFGAQFATVGRTASMAGSGGGPMPLSAWSPPSPQEHHYYDMLFTMADEEKRNAIGGRIAVAFFSRSNVDKGHLREIWTIADSQQRSELSRNEFYVAMRLISMAQRGEQVSVHRFYELASTPFPFPTLDGVPPPHAAPIPQPHGHTPASTPMAAGAPQGAYAITDEEKQRYDGIFQQYDTDHDGFLHGGEAVQLFGMSGLDRGVLRDIWAMADRGQDSRLDVKEFYVAMHLIVCVSKRALPMPAELPQEMAASAFGNRGSFTSTSSAPLASLGATPSRTNSTTMGMPVAMSAAPIPPSPQQPTHVSTTSHEPAPSATQGPMDAFAALSTGPDTSQASRVGSFGRTSLSGASLHQMPPPGSALDVNASAPSPSMSHAQPPPLAAVGGFGGSSIGLGLGLGLGSDSTVPGSTRSSFGGLGELARDRSGSASSVSSFASLSAEASALGPPHASGAMPGLAAMGSFHGLAPTSHNVHTTNSIGHMGGVVHSTPMPFLSGEGESAAVRHLDQTNEELVQTLQRVEKKQHAVELLSDKLRELDQLRHELVVLSMKRDSLASVAASASASLQQPPQHDNNAADTQAVRAVEHTLRELIEGEKAQIHKLHSDISTYEAEISKEQAALPAGGGFAGQFGGSPVETAVANTTTATHAPSTVQDTAAPMPFALSDSTPKSTFETFAGFGSSSPAPANSNDAFANFNFN